METSFQRLRRIGQQLRDLPEVHVGAGHMDQPGYRALHKLETDGARLIWEAYCQRAFREGSRFECLGRLLGQSVGPDAAQWSEVDSATGSKSVRLGGHELITHKEVEPSSAWLGLLWGIAMKLFAPEVGDYEDDEWIPKVCRRMARVVDAEAAVIEAEAAAPDTPAGGETVPSDTAGNADGAGGTQGGKGRGKRSTEKGEARVKIIAALTTHHKYQDGSCLKLEPIGNNELAREVDVSPSTASAFFAKEFKGYTKYRATCRDTTQLVASLKLLNQDFSPHHLFGGKSPDGGGRDDD